MYSVTPISFRFLLLITVLLALLSGCRDRKQDGPSLSETLEWMDSTYNPHGDAMTQELGRHGDVAEYVGEKMVSRHQQTFTFRGCEMAIHSEYYDAYYPNQFTSSTRFNLRDLDPNATKLNRLTRNGVACDFFPWAECDHAELVLYTRNRALLVDDESKISGQPDNTSTKRKSAEGIFLVSDVAYAERFAKAIHHAIDLCGGRPSTF